MTWEEHKDTVQVCSNGVRYIKAHLKLNPERDTKGNLKSFYRHISNLRKIRGSMGLLNRLYSDTDKAEVLHAFYTLLLPSKICLSEISGS